MNTESKVRAGFGMRDITPKVMVPMSGYDLRQACAIGVHDPLSVRALAIGDEDPLLLLSFDLLGIPSYHTKPLRNRLSGKFGVSGERIVFGAIHTHAAPKSIFRSFDCYDAVYAEYVLKQAEEAAAEALNDREERTVRFSESFPENVACFRDAGAAESHFAMPTETLWFEKEGKAPLLMVVFACHPTVLNEKNLWMSRDLVWGCEKALSERIPGSMPESMPESISEAKVIFFNGAAADVSTRYTRRASTFDEAARLGGILAESILCSRKSAAEAGDWTDLRAKAGELYVPPAAYFTGERRAEVLAYLNRKIETCPDERQKREFIACRSVLERKNYGIDDKGAPKQGETVYLQAVSAGDVKMLFLPFEYAQKDAAKLKKQAEEACGGHCLVICYSNGYDGYLPSGRPLEQDSGYEDMASNYRSDAKELVAARLMELTEGE